MSTVRNSQHIGMLTGGGHVSDEIKDHPTPGMAAKMLGLDFVMGTEHVQPSGNQFLAPLRSPQKSLLFRVVILCVLKILLLKEFIKDLKPDV